MTAEGGGTAPGARGSEAGGEEASSPPVADGGEAGNGRVADAGGVGSPEDTEDTGTAGAATGRPRQAPPADRFGWRGWLLVGAVLVAFVVVPVAILFLPAAKGLIRAAGLTLRDAYLVLPLVPALALASMAVWAALASRGA